MSSQRQLHLVAPPSVHCRKCLVVDVAFLLTTHGRVFADLIGALGSGTGILLAVTIIYVSLSTMCFLLAHTCISVLL